MGDTLFAILFAILVLSLLLFLLYLTCLFTKSCRLRKDHRKSSLYHVQVDSLNGTDPDAATDSTSLVLPHSDHDEDSSGNRENGDSKRESETFQPPHHKRPYFKFNNVDLTDTKPSHYLTPHSSKKHRMPHDREDRKGRWESEVARILVDNTGCRYTKGRARVLIPKVVLNLYYPEHQEINMTEFHKTYVDANKEVLI